MAKTVTINGGVAHLSVSDKHLSPLCGATRERPYEGRKAGIGDVTCTRCQGVMATAVKNVLAYK